MKRIISYLSYILILLLLVYYGGHYQEEIRVLAGRNFNPVPPILFSSVYSALIGIYLALPQFIKELRRGGSMQVNWLKILIIGIPALFISISGILCYLTPLGQSSIIQWIYMKYGLTGTAFTGVVFGYTLLSSITKEEHGDTVATGKDRVAKILILFLLAASLLYVSLIGVLYPVKLVEVHADIVKEENQTGYLDENGNSVFFIRTMIRYEFVLENMPNRRFLSQPPDDYQVRLEPKGELQSLMKEVLVNQPPEHGYSWDGKKSVNRLAYCIGSMDPGGLHSDIEPPAPEVLDKIRDSLYNADLVIEYDGQEIKRYSLLDYKAN